MLMKVLAVFSDLFVQSRITELVARTNGQVEFASNAEHVRRVLATFQPDLIVLDLSSSEYDAFSIAQEIRAKSQGKLFGVFPHVRKDLKTKADSTGFDFVVPNSGFLTILSRTMSRELKQD
jgi:PleD family two-component response regulator